MTLIHPTVVQKINWHLEKNPLQTSKLEKQNKTHTFINHSFNSLFWKLHYDMSVILDTIR